MKCGSRETLNCEIQTEGCADVSGELDEQHRKTSLQHVILGTKFFHFGGAWLFRRHVGCCS